MEKLFGHSLALLLINTSITYASDSITWLYIDYPPAYISSGPLKGQGFNDNSAKILKTCIKKYSHKRLDVNPNRLHYFLTKKEGIYCIACMGANKSSYDNSLFSNTAMVVPATGIVVRRKDVGKHFSHSQNSLNKLLSKDIQLGVISSGTYGVEVDKVIKKHKGSNKIIYRNLSNQTGFYDMLLMGRVDYVLDFAFSYSQNIKSLNKNQREELTFLPLTEAGEYKTAIGVCNKTAKSKEVMNLINSCIKSEDYMENGVKGLLKFIPKNLRARYKELNLRLLGKDSVN